MHTRFWSENLKRREHLGDLGVNGRILDKQCGKGWIEGWIEFLWFMEGIQWRALVNRV
jgi:hypothetical protein